MTPIPMILHCPRCHVQHIDAPNPEIGWDNRPHREHLCQFCGHLWTPSLLHTNGVATLPAQHHPVFEHFHAAWGKAKDQPDYDKAAWKYVQRYIEGDKA